MILSNRRVLNVFRHWVEFHYYDFEREPKLLAMLEEFVGSIKSRSMQKWVTSIDRALKKVRKCARGFWRILVCTVCPAHVQCPVLRRGGNRTFREMAWYLPTLSLFLSHTLSLTLLLSHTSTHTHTHNTTQHNTTQHNTTEKG